jgi:hypothetical protein
MMHPPNLVVSETPKVGLAFTMTLRGGKLISTLARFSDRNRTVLCCSKHIDPVYVPILGEGTQVGASRMDWSRGLYHVGRLILQALQQEFCGASQQLQPMNWQLPSLNKWSPLIARKLSINWLEKRSPEAFDTGTQKFLNPLGVDLCLSLQCSPIQPRRSIGDVKQIRPLPLYDRLTAYD